MNKQTSGKNSTVLLLLTLVVALLFAVYYYLVMPKKDEVVGKERSVASLQASALSLKEQIATVQSSNAPKIIDTFSLRKKVPDNREVDELLLNIEQIEFMSGSRILSIGFNNYDSLVSSSGLQDPNYTPPAEETTDGNATGEESADGTTTNSNASQNTDSNAEQSATLPVSTISPEQLPAELKMLTLSILVESVDYAALLKFIREVESLERVVRVDTISYSLNGEEALFSEEVSNIVSANIQVTTFYYEGLE